MPHGFEGWVGALLCKRPEDRFTRAADARYALAQLSSRMRDDAASVELIADEETSSVIADDSSSSGRFSPTCGSVATGSVGAAESIATGSVGAGSVAAASFAASCIADDACLAAEASSG